MDLGMNRKQARTDESDLVIERSEINDPILLQKSKKVHDSGWAHGRNIKIRIATKDTHEMG